MTRFLDAYNKGDQEQLRRFFPARAEIRHWLYSMNRGRKVEVVVDDRRDLLRYFAERHGQNDRMRLLSVMVTPDRGFGDGRLRVGGMAYSLVRRADDLRGGPEGAERPVQGKGFIDCRRQEIMALSMETLSTKPEDAPASISQCPKSVGRKQGDAILACTGEE